MRSPCTPGVIKKIQRRCKTEELGGDVCVGKNKPSGEGNQSPGSVRITAWSGN